MRYSDVVEGYLLDRYQTLGKNTLKSYEYWFADFAAFLNTPEIPFSDIAGADVQRYLRYLAQDRKLAESTRLRAWAVLSSLWTWAERVLSVPHIIRGKVEKPKLKPLQLEPFSMEEVKAIVQAAQYNKEWFGRSGGKARSKRPTAKRDVAIILTLVDCGLRASELCQLTRADYDKESGRLLIQHGKGDKERVVYLGNQAKTRIWQYYTERRQVGPNDPLFATKTNRPLDRNNLRHMLNRLGTAANVDNVHPHRFRHTFAINFLRNGGNVFALQRILGHERLDTVRVYVKLAQTDLAEAQKTASPVDNWKL